MVWRTERRVHELFLLNIALQLFDGVATYQGLQHRFMEGNPLLVALLPIYGTAGTLLVAKAKACGLLVFLRRLGGQRMVPDALVMTAATYGCLSFVPWLTRLASLLSA